MSAFVKLTCARKEGRLPSDGRRMSQENDKDNDKLNGLHPPLSRVQEGHPQGGVHVAHQTNDARAWLGGLRFPGIEKYVHYCVGGPFHFLAATAPSSSWL